MAILKNPKHEHFAQKIADGVNQTEAAKAAGYSERTACEQGSRLFRNVQIRARVEELRKRVSEQAVSSSGISKAWVVEKLIAIAEKCTSKEHYAPAAANKSLELLGKDLGMFRDYVRIEVFNDMMAQMGTAVAKYVADAEILERIATDWGKITMERKVKSGDGEAQVM